MVPLFVASSRLARAAPTGVLTSSPFLFQNRKRPPSLAPLAHECVSLVGTRKGRNKSPNNGRCASRPQTTPRAPYPSAISAPFHIVGDIIARLRRIHFQPLA